MFGNEIALAKTQGGHGSHKRTGEIMKMIVGYGKAAHQRSRSSGIDRRIDEQVKNREFPGDLNKQRVSDVEDAIAAIEAATTQPELRSIQPATFLPEAR